MSDLRAHARSSDQPHANDESEIVSTLARIGAALTSDLDLQKIVQTVTDETTQLTGAEFGAFFYNVLNDAGESYTLYTLSGVPREAFSNFPMPRATAVFAPTFHGTEVVRSGDITKDPRYGKNAPYYGKPAGHLPVVSYLAVPVISRAGKVLGGLFFGHSQPDVFSELDERLVVGTASWAAVAMDNARLLADAVAARNEAERARKQAEEANRTKAEFLAAMSHELRTPLNAIGGYAELITMGIGGPVTEQQLEYLSRIRGSQQHLLGIITDLLNYSRIEAGHVSYELGPVPYRGTLDSVLPLVIPQARVKDIVLTAEPCQENCTAQADSTKTEQIVLNLLSNAVKFTQSGGRVRVRCARDGDRVSIIVEDTGPGIPPDKLNAIFEPFVQLGRTRTSQHEGTGLGLAISRDLARAMNGDVSVESTVGEGSTFTLSLPRASE